MLLSFSYISISPIPIYASKKPPKSIIKLENFVTDLLSNLCPVIER